MQRNLRATRDPNVQTHTQLESTRVPEKFEILERSQKDANKYGKTNKDIIINLGEARPMDSRLHF